MRYLFAAFILPLYLFAQDKFFETRAAMRVISEQVYHQHNLYPKKVEVKIDQTLQKAYFYFLNFEPMGEAKAKEVGIAVAKKILSSMNASEKIAPYRPPEGFSLENIDVMVQCFSANYNPVPPKSVERIFVVSGNIGVINYE